MIEFDADHKTFRIIIPVSHPKEAGRYHQSLVNLLEKIEIDEDTPAFIEDLDCIYELMSHLLPDQTFMDQYKAPTDDT